MTTHTDQVARIAFPAKQRISENLLMKAAEAEALKTLTEAMIRIIRSSHRWDDGPITQTIYNLDHFLPDPEELRARAENDMYLGNRAAFHKEI